MDMPEFTAFRDHALAHGYDEVAERNWAANETVPLHSHPFGVHALVVRGAMWLSVDGQTRHLLPGDSFDLRHDVPHAERYGAEGATYWVARRHFPRPDSED